MCSYTCNDILHILSNYVAFLRRQNTKEAYIKYLIIEVSQPVHKYKIIIIKTVV
jgi:hypothetical protein